MHFNIDDCSERIYHPKTKEYFREVISSFKNDNYRSAVVMLYSVTICDLIYKLKEASDIYNDTKATEILVEINQRQESSPTSPDWEAYLIENIIKGTRLLDSHEGENLKYLRQHRHLSAHPVLNQVDILFSPNPETALAHIRNIVEGVLSKGALLGGDIFSQFAEDIANEKQYLADEHTLKKYIESKYLRPMSPLLENKVFKSFWRIVFKNEDAKCEENRDINYKVLYIMLERNKSNFLKLLDTEKKYFSIISDKQTICKKMIDLIVDFPEIFELLEDHAIEKLKTKIKAEEALIIKAYFLAESVVKHLIFLSDRYHKEEMNYYETRYYINKHVFTRSDIKFLHNLAMQKGFLDVFYILMIEHYKHSTDFSTAEIIYDYCIEPYLNKFNKEQIMELLDAVDSNRQVHDPRRRFFTSEMKKIKARADELLGEFDFEERFRNIDFQ